MEEEKKSLKEETQVEEAGPPPPGQGGGGGWGGWGFSPLSVLSDLQKAATVAAEEISRNAAAVAKSAATGIADVQNVVEDSESSNGEEEEVEESAIEGTNEDGKENLRKSALDKLEKASDDSFLGQGLKVFDNSVENFASGAWQAIGSAWKGGSNLVQKLEHSAANLAESIQNGSLPATAGSVAPSLLETGKAFTAKGMQVLETVGKETMDLLITETGIEVEKNPKEAEQESDDDQLFEDVTFDRCFYIYGGPEQMEELEALSNHYALLYNRRKAKVSHEQKSAYDGRLRQIQQIFSLSTEMDGRVESDKGKKIETNAEGSYDEMRTLHDSSVRKAADLAAGFTNALTGLAANDIIQRTAGRLDSLHSEGVHRLSEMCCFAVSQLLILGKSIISNASKVQDEKDSDEDTVNIDWPEDSVEKAKIVRTKAQSMTVNVEAVSNSFITGISDVAEAFQAAIKGATAESHEVLPQTSIQEKAKAFSEHLCADQNTAMSKIQDGLQYLSFVVLSTSMPAA